MIQELFGGSNNNNPGFLSGTGDRKMSSLVNGGSTGAILQPPSLPPPSTTTTVATNSTIPKTPANNNTNNNNQMQCPRCDSANTKFCYYNNYNLTQPRYFCKTCRRYWTKGGALRNVPIGGGCRRNKPAHIPTAKAKPAGAAAGEMMFSPPPATTPILWGSPHTSHLLPLLRSSSPTNNIPHHYYQSASPNHNPNPSPNAALVSLGRSVGLDPAPSLSSLWRSSSSSPSSYGFTFGDHHQQSSGGVNKELYQRLGSLPGNSYYNNGHSTSTGMTSLSSSSSSVLESAMANNGGAELGFWNSNATFSWSDLQPSTATNGTYP